MSTRNAVTSRTIALALGAATASGAPLADAAGPSPAASTWEIDTGHAATTFKVRHLMLSQVRGSLGPVSGTVTLDEHDISRSHVEVSIDARGLDTRNEKRDEHLRSADFFDVAHHPSVTFRSTKVQRTANGHLTVTGPLTIRGISKDVSLDVDPLAPALRDPWGNQRRGVFARTTLDRRNWNLTWNLAMEAGGLAVGDRVEVEIEAELVAKTPQPTAAR